MKTLIPVGFYRELTHGAPNGPSLREALSSEPWPERALVVEYLRGGALFIASTGIAADVLDPSRPLIGGLNILTDGTYAWPSDLAHYVEKHGARPPADLLAHMASRSFRAPEDVDVMDLDLDALE